MKPRNPFETALLLAGIIVGFAVFVGCTGESECGSDADCPSGQRCASGGGIFWNEKVCVFEGIDYIPDAGVERDTGADVDTGIDPDADPPANQNQPDQNDSPGTVPGDPPVPGEDPGWVGGQSVNQRPIIVEYFGEEGPLLFVISATHGDERLTVTSGERFRTELQAGFAEDHGIQVLFIQSGNPDGVADYLRENANGITLNRNFPASNFESGGPGGQSAASEPETETIQNAIDASGLSAMVTLRCCVAGFDYDGPAEPLAEAMAQAMGQDFGVLDLGASPGSMGSYVGLDMERPIVTAMFDVAEQADPHLQLEGMELAMEAAAQWTWDSFPLGGDEVAFDDMTTEDGWSYRSRQVGTSAGGLPLRVETVGGEEQQRFLLLSGIDGTSRRGAWTAEHIRREILALPDLDAGFWHFITAVNPDGLAAGDVRNDDGDNVEIAIGQMDTSVPEVDALVSITMELMMGEPVTIFLVGNSADDTDRVYLAGSGSDELAEYVPDGFSASPSPDDPELADGLADFGHRVVQIDVGTKTLEAQSEDGLVAPGYASPFVYSEMVMRMAGLM